MRILVSTLAVAAALVAAAPASAAQFLFTYSGTGAVLGAFTASGTLTTTNTTTLVAGRQAYTITGITGTRNGAAITGLSATGTDFGGIAIDNYLYVTGPFLTSAGFGFSVAGTGNLFNPYYFGNVYQEYVRDAANNDLPEYVGYHLHDHAGGRRRARASDLGPDDPRLRRHRRRAAPSLGQGRVRLSHMPKRFKPPVDRPAAFCCLYIRRLS